MEKISIVKNKTDTKFLGIYETYFRNVIPIDENKICKYYKAINVFDNNDVCLKVINLEELKHGDYDYYMNQMKKEEKINELLESSHIMKIYNKYENSNYIIYELEYFEMTLEKFIKKNKILNKKNIVFSKVLQGIGYALLDMNNKEIIHRDIKPSNIFLSESFEAKLGGFGCSIFSSENINDPVGSLYYTAPEIIKNLPYDEKCDLWSFGVILYEILFGHLPYGKNLTPKLLKEIIYYEDNLFIRKTLIPILDTFFKGLLTINSKNRINYIEFKKLLFTIFNSFYKVYIIKDNHCSSFPIYSYERKFFIQLDIKSNLSKEEYKTKDFVINKIMNIIEGEHLPSIMNISNGYGYINEDHKYNNIIYYDENLDFIEKIHKYSYIFEKNTHGAFILCTNLKSLEILKTEIIRQYKIDKKYIFNLIISGSKCQIVLDYIKKDLNFQKCIINVCVFCMELEKYQYLKDIYPELHNDIYNKAKDVVNFIEKYSSSDIKPYKITQLITFGKYKTIYKDRHIKICEFYGDFNPSIYQKSFKNLISLIDEESKKGELKKQNTNKLKDSFSKFGLFGFGSKKEKDEDKYKDILYLDKLIIKEYTYNTFYKDLNKWLINFPNNAYEAVAYFTARLMYSLNSYARENKMFYKKNNQTLYRGIKLPYSSLLPYERAKGLIILFSSFTSTSESIISAKKFCKENILKNYMKQIVFFLLYF